LQERPAKKAKTGYSGLEAPFPTWRAVFQRKSFDFLLSHVLEIKRFASKSNTTT
jgi:hypothetical protein